MLSSCRKSMVKIACELLHARLHRFAGPHVRRTHHFLIMISTNHIQDHASQVTATVNIIISHDLTYCNPRYICSLHTYKCWSNIYCNGKCNLKADGDMHLTSPTYKLQGRHPNPRQHMNWGSEEDDWAIEMKFTFRFCNRCPRLWYLLLLLKTKCLLHKLTRATILHGHPSPPTIMSACKSKRSAFLQQQADSSRLTTSMQPKTGT